MCLTRANSFLWGGVSLPPSVSYFTQKFIVKVINHCLNCLPIFLPTFHNKWHLNESIIIYGELIIWDNLFGHLKSGFAQYSYGYYYDPKISQHDSIHFWNSGVLTFLLFYFLFLFHAQNNGQVCNLISSSVCWWCSNIFQKL